MNGRQSTIFESEADMARPVRAWLGSTGLQIEAEVATSTGVCDLVGFRFRPAAVRRRTEAGQRQPIASRPVAFVYALLPEDGPSVRGRRIGALRKLAGLTYSPELAEDLPRVVNRLIRQNHVVRSPAGSLLRNNGWWPLHDRVVAVELKLAQHAAVLDQAVSNRRFATESFAALPADVVARSRASTLGQYRAAGVGLLAVETGGCRVVTEPASGGAEHLEQLLAVEKLWRDHRARHCGRQ